MAGLTEQTTSPNGIFGNIPAPLDCKLELTPNSPLNPPSHQHKLPIKKKAAKTIQTDQSKALKSKQNMASTDPRLIYVTYKDHVFFKNVKEPPAKAVVRETIGWVKQENEDLLLIESDRSLTPGCKGINDILILKNCIIEKYALPSGNIFGAYLEPNISSNSSNCRVAKKDFEVTSPDIGAKNSRSKRLQRKSQ